MTDTDGAPIESLTVVTPRVPVRGDTDASAVPTFGLLTLGSSGARRFHDDMDTTYPVQTDGLAAAAPNHLRD